MKLIKCPSVEDLKNARRVFLEKEPRDLFYYIASELIELAINERTKVTLSEAVAVLLQTWNKSYYQFRPFDNEHFNKIDILIKKYDTDIIMNLRSRSILSISDNDMEKICNIFHEFEQVLGPVGAAKSLHLLAPNFFPLWDRKIASEYKVPLGPVGTNSEKYWDFIETFSEQCKTLNGRLSKEDNLLKVIDEYNYCHYTKDWI